MHRENCMCETCFQLQTVIGVAAKGVEKDPEYQRLGEVIKEEIRASNGASELHRGGLVGMDKSEARITDQGHSIRARNGSWVLWKDGGIRVKAKSDECSISIEASPSGPVMKMYDGTGQKRIQIGNLTIDGGGAPDVIMAGVGGQPYLSAQFREQLAHSLSAGPNGLRLKTDEKGFVCGIGVGIDPIPPRSVTLKSLRHGMEDAAEKVFAAHPGKLEHAKKLMAMICEMLMEEEDKV